jgi:general secretion pathway protein K
MQKQQQASLKHFSNVSELWEIDPFNQIEEEQRAVVNDFLGVQSNYFKVRIDVMLNERKRQFSSDLVRKEQTVYVAYRSMAPF